MLFKASVQPVRAVEKDVWVAEVAPEDVRRLGRSVSQIGDRSIVLIVDPIFDAKAQRLEFDPARSTPLNVGASSETLLIAHSASASTVAAGEADHSAGGDGAFTRALSSLSSSMRDVGIELLSRVRDRATGSLALKGQGKFVETPDNFWTIKVQPRDGSLAVTVRGAPAYFRAGVLQIKDDRPGYSRFKIEKREHLDDAVRVILSARRRSN